MNITETSSNLVGISTAVPKFEFNNLNYDLLDSDKLVKFIEITGIKKRRIVNKNICTSDLAVNAGEKLLTDLNWKKDEIDFVLLITQTPDYLTPATSIIIQDRMQLKKNLFTLDINLGCSGFPYGITLANSLIDNFNFKKGILFIGDVSSKLCNYNDKSTWPLFGDACSAVAFEKKSKTKVFSDFYTDGSAYTDIIVPSHSLAGRNELTTDSFKNKKDKELIRNDVNMHLNGANIYSFAISSVPKKINEIILFSKINIKKIKYCFLHQANKLINQTIESKLNFRSVEYPTSIEEFGNTSSATIPITITKNFSSTYFSGLSILCGFGVGLSLATLIIDFKDVKVSKLVELE
ncbi:ketoacyl-ACP synthase III [Pelagibacterales bacterium SAG-MED35]|nr:ketoacyl-ACP synthase III [Pelagibacterales bacterium SAG-MED35]